MSLAETALQERAECAEPEAVESPLPFPGEYKVESSGAPKQVPPDSIIAIKVIDIGGVATAVFMLDSETLGNAIPLLNGDFAVSYQFGGAPARIQFRQTGPNAEYMFGVSMAISPPTGAGPMEEPPITGVWGAEARPPKEPYPVE